MADPTLRALFAARLMQARQLRALSQRALGDRMGLGKQKGSSRINRYEHQVTAIGFDSLETLAQVDRPEFCRHSVAALRVAPFKLYR